MKNYLVALKPFLIFAILRMINSLLGPVLLNLQFRMEKPELLLGVLPYLRLGSTVIDLIGIVLMVWVGYRISKRVYPGIWLSASAGISFYGFSILLAVFMVSLTPILVALLSSLILWIPIDMNVSFPFHVLKHFFTIGTPQTLLLYSGYGLVGGFIFSLQMLRNKKRRWPSDAQAEAGR